MGDFCNRVELAQFHGSCGARDEAQQAVVRHWVDPKEDSKLCCKEDW